MKTKKEFLQEKDEEYKQMKKAAKLAAELEKRIAEIRASGFRLIVLGCKVKITLDKYYWHNP